MLINKTFKPIYFISMLLLATPSARASQEQVDEYQLFHILDDAEIQIDQQAAMQMQQNSAVQLIQDIQVIKNRFVQNKHEYSDIDLLNDKIESLFVETLIVEDAEYRINKQYGMVLQKSILKILGHKLKLLTTDSLQKIWMFFEQNNMVTEKLATAFANHFQLLDKNSQQSLVRKFPSVLKQLSVKDLEVIAEQPYVWDLNAGLIYMFLRMPNKETFRFLVRQYIPYSERHAYFFKYENFHRKR